MPHLLTSNQLFILEMIAHGLSSKDIAFLKEVSVRTIDDAREKIIATLGVKNMAEAVAKAMSGNKLVYQPEKFEELKLIFKSHSKKN